MSPFDELYGHSFNTSICWSDPMNTVLTGLDDEPHKWVTIWAHYV